jgi:hypothetical protein
MNAECASVSPPKKKFKQISIMESLNNAGIHCRNSFKTFFNPKLYTNSHADFYFKSHALY